jgi:glucose-6-phosphate 1-dehydrogenase
MLQNHLLQVLSLVAMEPPTSFAAGSLRSRKVDVLQAIRPIPADRMSEFAVRGQYGPGWDRGQEVVGYRQEEGVTDGSVTETYAALKLLIDNWRWQGVPFYLRTGKRLPAKVSEVNIFFRPVPHRLFPPSVDSDWSPDRLTLRLQPDESILLSFLAKRPGQNIRLSPVEMRFCYDEYFTETPPTAYETLLRDVTQGDPALFKRIDQVESSWRAVQPVLDTWRDSPPTSFPDYQAGSWGPDAADRLLARDGRSWAPPALDRRGGES